MNILGISAFYHDSAACLLRDGVIVAAAQEERFTRKKHDPEFPRRAVASCLKEGGISVADLDLVAFYDKPLLKFERLLETYLGYAPFGFRSFLTAMPLWLKQKLFLDDLIRKELVIRPPEKEGGKAEVYEGKILYPEHHESHAASAFFPSPFREAATLTADGVGEWATTSYGIGRENRVSLLAEIRFPHSLGMLYSAFTYYTGFKVNSGEYKVMGLAPYGDPKYVDVILEHLIDLREDGSYRLNMEYFNYCQGLTMTNSKFASLFGGPPREPETHLTQKEMDLAASVQVVTELAMVAMARHVRKATGQKHLVLAGGVALNCVANGRILRERIFDDIWIQPAAGDAGGALGAALVAWHHHLGHPRLAPPRRGSLVTETASTDEWDADGRGLDRQQGSYLGPAHTNEEIEALLRQIKAPFHRFAERELIETSADLIASEKVIGWFQGRMEFGPRALGNRSIIGDARSSEMQSVMNLKIKFRESFRPFAPSVIEEAVSDWFEIDRPSPYMLLTADVRAEHRLPEPAGADALWGIEKLKVVRSKIPAITHVDYSARLQTVSRRDNPRYHALIEAVGVRTGCPVIINTSFNVRGEPIVESPLDAYRCFMRTHIDVLVLNDFVLHKSEQPEWNESGDWRKEFVLD